MSNESVDELISQLEAIRIEETDILQRLVAARERETRVRARDARTAHQGTRTQPDRETESFIVGGRVQITNNVRLTFGRTATINDKRAVITKITPTRIYFRTVNGTNTWRARTNLRIVDTNEVWTY
jgi:hypothetical protein